jgi:hypothetical protein
MSTFQSKITIARPISEVYSFLADLNNHRQLMPDNIQDWKSTYDTAGFSIPNMGKIALKVDSRSENSEIIIIPAEKPPFDIKLKWGISGGENSTEVVLTISAELNMMLKMMASGPLQKLADHETRTLGAIFS